MLGCWILCRQNNTDVERRSEAESAKKKKRDKKRQKQEEIQT